MSIFAKQLLILSESIKSLLTSHSSSDDHDDRYLTKTEVGESINTKQLSVSSTSFNLIESTGVIDVSLGDIFTITATANVAVELINVPANRVLFITIRVLGVGPINWPLSVEWSDGTEPMLGSSWTIVNLSLIDGMWYGSSEQRN